MSTTVSPNLTLPLIDLTRYLHPASPTDRESVIAEIRAACQQFGFFQLKGHGIPRESQSDLLKALNTFFSLPREEKLKLSFLDNLCRRGYEASGMSLREGDPLPDSKESFYIGREEPEVIPPGFHGPNQWPSLQEPLFRSPVWTYYMQASELGKTIFSILFEGLGHPASTVEKISTRPLVMMKMIRYPPLSATLPGQLGVGAHTDFGGVTVLLQQTDREGLEVWHEETQAWVPVPAVDDVLVINCGDMIAKWSGGVYRSARHRVLNKSAGDKERLSCALFWHGDADATNPLAKDGEGHKETVGKLILRRFGSQFSLDRKVLEGTRTETGNAALAVEAM
ncbi:hypothetical protein BDW72DRAFT_197980 [Aspergillus terricola var. indicus]